MDGNKKGPLTVDQRTHEQMPENMRAGIDLLFPLVLATGRKLKLDPSELLGCLLTLIASMADALPGVRAITVAALRHAADALEADHGKSERPVHRFDPDMKVQ